MATDKNIGKILSELATEIKKSNESIIDESNFSIYGDVLQSFKDFNEVITDINKNGNSHLNFSDVKQDLIMSISALRKVTNGKMSDITAQLQSGVVDMLNSTQDIITKQVNDMSKSMQKIEHIYSEQISRIRKNGENVIRTTASNTVKRTSNNVSSEQYNQGIIAMPSAIVANNVNAQSKLVERTLQNADDVLNLALKKSSNTYASSLDDLKNFVTKYKRIIDSSLIQGINSQIENFTGYDKNFNLSSLKPIAQSIIDAIPQTVRDNFKISTKTTNSKQWTAYNTDEFYGGQLGGKKFVDNIIKEVGLGDLISGSLLKQRIGQIGGNTQGLNTNSEKMKAQLLNMFSKLEEFGIGSYWEKSKSGQTARIGFFNADDRDKVFSSSGNGVTANWDKMAKFTLGIPNSQGNVVVGNMNRPDVFVPRFNDEVGISKVEMATLSQTIFEQFANIVSSDFFLSSLKKGNYNAAISRLRGGINDLVENVATNSTYGVFSQDSINDVIDDMFAGSNPTKRLYQSNTVKLKSILENLYKSNWGNGKLPEAKQMEQMMQYVFAKFNGNEDVFLNNSNYQWLTSGTSQLNLIADSLKKYMPNAGISKIKEVAFLTGDIAGVDSNALAPFFVTNSGVNRAISQGANGIKRAHNVSKKNQRAAILRSPIAMAGGIDYNAPENQQYVIAEATNDEIANALRSYYDELATFNDTDTLSKLYRRYYGKKAYNKVKGNVDKIVEGLKNREMPSTYEGSAIASDKFRREQEGYRTKTVEITEDDLGKLGITARPTSSNPIMQLNKKDYEKAISGRGVRLSDGTLLKGNSKIGDRLHSISYDKTTGKYQLAYDEFMGDKYVKHTSSAGDRLTLGSYVTEGELEGINNYLGLKNNKADIFIEPTKVDNRKLPGLVQKKYEQLFQRIKQVGKLDEFQQYIKSNSKPDGTYEYFKDILDDDYNTEDNMSRILSKMFDFDSENGVLLQKLFNPESFKKTFSREEAKQLYNVFDKNGIYANLIRKFLTNQDYEELMHRNIGSAAMSKSDEYYYFDPLGSTSKKYAETNSHYKYTQLEDMAIARELGLLKTAGIDNSELAEVFTNYTSADENTVQELKNKENELRQAYNSTVKGKIGKNVDDYISLFGDGLTDEISYSNSGISKGAFLKTILGSAYNEKINSGKTSYIDLTSQHRKQGINISEDDQIATNIKRLIVPNLKPNVTHKGLYTVDELEGKFRSVLKNLDYVNAYENRDDFDSQDTAYKSAVSDLEKSVGELLASENNALYYKKGSLQTGLQNTRLTNAMSAKAISKSFSQSSDFSSNYADLENAVVVNDEDFKALLKTGEGGDIRKNIKNLAMQAKHMLSGSDDEDSKKALKFIEGLKRSNLKDSDLGKTEDNLINLISNLSNVENGRKVGLQAWFHRNPLINGEDIKFTNLLNSSKIGRGQMYNSLGLATDVNMDYDGDTGYLALPMFGASDEATFNMASKQFDKFKEIQNYVNNTLKRFVLKDYSTKNGYMNNESLLDNSAKAEKAIDTVFDNNGRDDTLQSILSKTNFKYVGSLDNFAKSMYLALADGLDEQSGDPLIAARSILGRELFEQMTQESISSKKIGQRLQNVAEKNGSTKESVYEKELGNLEEILFTAKNIGKTGSSSEGISNLVKALETTNLLDFNSPNRGPISAIARVEKMLQMRYGENSEEYVNAMKELGIWESRTNGGDKAGTLSAEQFIKILTPLANKFDQNHPGQGMYRYGSKRLAEMGQYLTNSTKIADLLQYRNNVRQSQVLGGIETDTKDSVTGEDIKTLSFHDIAELINPTGSRSSWKEIEQRLETDDKDTVSKLLSAQSDSELGEALGLNGTNNVKAFKKSYIRKQIGTLIHNLHQNTKTPIDFNNIDQNEIGFADNELYAKIFGTAQKAGMLERLGISSEMQDQYKELIMDRYEAEEKAFNAANEDIINNGNYKIFNEIDMSGKLGNVNGKKVYAQGIADRIISGKNSSGKNEMRFAEWKGTSKLGINEFSQNLLQVAIAQRMQDMAQELATNPNNNLNYKQIAEKLKGQFGGSFKGKIDENFVESLLSTEVFSGELIGSSNGKTRVYRTKGRINLSEQVEDAIIKGKALSAIFPNKEAMEKAVTSPYEEVKSAEQSSLPWMQNESRINPEDMLKEYRNYINQKSAIDRNYQTLQAQLAGMSDKDPDRKALEDRMKNLEKIKEGYSKIQYGFVNDNTFAKITEEGTSYTIVQDEMIDNFKKVTDGADIQNKAMMKIANTNATVTKTVATLTGQFKGMLQYYAMYGMVQKVIGAVMQQFQKFIQSVKDLDSAMVNLQIVTGKSRDELKDSVSGYSEIADEMGRTTTEVMSAANDWLRAGYNIEDANTLIRESLKLSTLGMIDAEKATEALLSTLKGWKLGKDDIAEVVDNLTALDVAYATTAGDLATAMAKGNVSASLAGVDMKNYEAYLATVLDVSQQGADTVGTAFRTLFARYGNVKSGKYANNYNSSESNSETSEETAKLNDVETVLNKLQIKTRNTVGEFRSMDEVLDEIASKWNSFDKVTQNAITTAMAGTRQRETLNVLFENFDQVKKARKVIDESEGSADKKYEAYTSSIAGSQKRLENAMQKIADGEGWKNTLIDIYDILKTGTDFLGVILDNLKVIAGVAGALIVLKNIGSVGSLISRIGTSGTNFFRGIGNGIGNTATGIKGLFSKKTWNNLNDYANAQATYEYGVGINKTAQNLYGKLSSANQLGYNLQGPAYTGNVFDANDYTAATRLLTNSKFVDMSRTLGASNTNNMFKNVLEEFSNSNPNDEANLHTAYINYINALNGETQNVEELNATREQLNIALKNVVNKEMLSGMSDKEIDDMFNSFIDVTAGNGMTPDQIAASALIYKNGNGKIRIPGENNKNKGFFKSNLGQSMGMMGGMALGTAGTALVGSNSEHFGAGQTMALSMLTSFAPMIGNAIAPGVGGLVGGAISVAVGGIATYIAKNNKTTEEILKETQKATEEISGLKENLSKDQETLTNLKDSEVRFAELVKGVNSTTGKNVSLSDTEWSEYQNILSSIIDSRNDLYASYDEEGNIVAKNAGKIADLNKVMSESISQTEEQIRLKNWEIANNKDKKGNYNIASYVNQGAVSAYSEIEKTLGNLSDYFNFTQVTTNTDSRYWLEDNSGIFEKYGIKNYSASDTNLSRTNEYFNKLLKAGASAEELYKVFGSILNTEQEVTQEDFLKIYSPIISNYAKVASNVQQEYTNGLRNALKTNFEGKEEYLSLSNDEQNYLSQTVFGNIQANPYKKNDQSKGIKDIEDVSKAYDRYKTVSENAMKWAMLNPDKMEFLSGYDESTMTIANDKTRTQYLLEMLKGQDAGSVRSILEGMGYDENSLKKYFHMDKNGKWFWDGNFDNIVEGLKSSVDKNLQELVNKGFSKDKLETLTGAEFNALYTNRDALQGYTNSSAEELQRKLKEFTLGNNGTLSEYLSDFSNEMDVAISNTEEFAKALDTAEGKGTFAFEKLQKLANNLGIDIHELADHASTLGSIDANGYNSKSLSEIETQFEDIENIVNDLTDNSTISAENVEKIIEDFPELVKYLDDSDKLLEKFQSLQGDKSKSQVASLKRSFAESDEVYKSLLNDTKFSDNEDFDKIIEQRLGMFKNGRKLTEFMNTIYNKDINDNYTEIKSEYEKMSLTDNSSYSQNSWEKLIGENIFGIDTSTGTKEEIQKKIYNAMKTQAEKMGVKNIDSIGNGGMNQLTKMFTNIIGQTDLMAAFQQVSDLQNQLSALKTAKAIEDSKWEQRVSDAISKLKQDFEEGRTSIDDYIKGLQQIKTWAGLTAEQQNELNEAIEEARFDKISDQYEKGAISVKAYRDELSALMKLNASGSSQYKQYADAYISSYDTEFNKLEAQMSLVAEKDFAQQENILTKERLVIQEQLMALVAAGMQDSEEYLEKQKELKSIDEKRLEIEKKRVELHKEDLETTMSAYTTLLDYGISQLEKEKSLLEERYDEEIDKLKEVNDQKQRSIDLEKYQQQLENAKKEKSRVYIAGTGWTYRANQAKVDEAQRNLDNYLDDRKISDLEGSKNRESKYYQDQIDFYNEMKEKVEDVPKLANAEDAVRQLIKDGILSEGSTIPDSLNTLRQNTKLDNEGHVTSLGGKFESIKNDYLTTTEKLWDINSDWDQNLLDIANKIRASEPITTEMLKKAFKDGVSQVDIKIPTGKDYSEQIKEIQRKLATAQSTLNNIAMSAAAISYKDTTSSSGVWSKGMNKVDMSKTYKGLDGQKYWKMTNTETGDEWYIRANTSNVRDIWNKRENRYATVANKGTDYYRSSILGFSSGIEAGMVTRTGMYKLHGSPSNPEFVLNSKQAYQLLKNISTLSIPAFESNSGKSQTIKYQFYGDLNLPNVQDPSTFFDELLRETNSKFNVSKPEYS